MISRPCSAAVFPSIAAGPRTQPRSDAIANGAPRSPCTPPPRSDDTELPSRCSRTIPGKWQISSADPQPGIPEFSDGVHCRTLRLSGAESCTILPGRQSVARQASRQDPALNPILLGSPGNACSSSPTKPQNPDSRPHRRLKTLRRCRRQFQRRIQLERSLKKDLRFLRRYPTPLCPDNRQFPSASPRRSFDSAPSRLADPVRTALAHPARAPRTAGMPGRTRIFIEVNVLRPNSSPALITSPQVSVGRA